MSDFIDLKKVHRIRRVEVEKEENRSILMKKISNKLIT